MGDGENGLALAIFVGVAAMLAGGFALFFALGWSLSRHRRALVGLGAGLLGTVLGGCLVAATFFEDSWTPPPRLRLDVPAGFAPQWVVLIEAPAAPRSLAWRGFHAPFHGISAELQVPPGGVIRVRSLAEIAGRGGTTVEWSDGASMVGFTGGTAPAGLGGRPFVAYQRQLGAAAADEVLPDGEALTAYVRAHGG